MTSMSGARRARLMILFCGSFCGSFCGCSGEVDSDDGGGLASNSDPPCGERLLDDPALELTPRTDTNLEKLALLLSDGLAVDQPTYERVVRDVSAIRELQSDVEDVTYRSPHANSLSVYFEDPGVLDEVESGEYRGWQCINEALGAMVLVERTRSGFAYASLFFNKTLNLLALSEIYRGFPGVEDVEPTGIAGDGSSICPVKSEDGWHYVFDVASGDCPAGCIDHIFYHFVVNEDAMVVASDPWNFNAAPDDPPEWVNVFAEAGRLLGKAGFCHSY